MHPLLVQRIESSYSCLFVLFVVKRYFSSNPDKSGDTTLFTRLTFDHVFALRATPGLRNSPYASTLVSVYHF